tara:strand:+ start:13284 stop:13451 length:168 start_codon:yes stop_codon:yes gene_type:complete
MIGKSNSPPKYPCDNCGATFSWLFSQELDEGVDLYECENCNNMYILRRDVEEDDN